MDEKTIVATATDPDRRMHVLCHGELLPATFLQYFDQCDSPFFGYYKCSFSKADYTQACGGKGLAKLGFLMEEDATLGLLIAIVSPEHCVVGHTEQPPMI